MAMQAAMPSSISPYMCGESEPGSNTPELGDGIDATRVTRRVLPRALVHLGKRCCARPSC